MSADVTKILLVEDDLDAAEQILQCLKGLDCFGAIEISHARTKTEFEKLMSGHRREGFDIALMDYHVPGERLNGKKRWAHGKNMMELLSSEYPHTLTICISGASREGKYLNLPAGVVHIPKKEVVARVGEIATMFTQHQEWLRQI